MHVLSHVHLSDSMTPWTAASQAPLSKGFSRQEYRRGLPFPPPRDLPNSGIEFTSFATACISRLILFYCATWESQVSTGRLVKGSGSETPQGEEGGGQSPQAREPTPPTARPKNPPRSVHEGLSVLPQSPDGETLLEGLVGQK